MQKILHRKYMYFSFLNIKNKLFLLSSVYIDTQIVHILTK